MAFVFLVCVNACTYQESSKSLKNDIYKDRFIDTLYWVRARKWKDLGLMYKLHLEKKNLYPLNLLCCIFLDHTSHWTVYMQMLCSVLHTTLSYFIFLSLQFWINGHINDDVVIIITIFFLQPAFFLVWHIYDIFVIGTPGLWWSYDFFFLKWQL